MPETHAFSKELILMLCGGKFPDVPGIDYDWNVVQNFRMIDDRIIPYADGVAVGPDLKIVVAPNQDNTNTVLLKALD